MWWLQASPKPFYFTLSLPHFSLVAIWTSLEPPPEFILFPRDHLRFRADTRFIGCHFWEELFCISNYFCIFLSSVEVKLFRLLFQIICFDLFQFITCICIFMSIWCGQWTEQCNTKQFGKDEYCVGICRCIIQTNMNRWWTSHSPSGSFRCFLNTVPLYKCLIVMWWLQASPKPFYFTLSLPHFSLVTIWTSLEPPPDFVLFPRDHLRFRADTRFIGCQKLHRQIPHALLGTSRTNQHKMR